MTISASQMEAALSHTSDHQDLVNIRESAFLMNLVEAVQEHQMNVINASEYSLVLQKKKKSASDTRHSGGNFALSVIGID